LYFFFKLGEINLMRVDVFLQEIGSIEEIILKNNARKEDYQKSMMEKRNYYNQKNETFQKNNKFTENNIIREKTTIIENNQKNRMAALKIREEFTAKGQDSAPSIENSIDPKSESQMGIN